MKARSTRCFRRCLIVTDLCSTEMQEYKVHVMIVTRIYYGNGSQARIAIAIRSEMAALDDTSLEPNLTYLILGAAY
jgi:hypothetical protein